MCMYIWHSVLGKWGELCSLSGASGSLHSVIGVSIVFPEPSFLGFHKTLMILGVSIKVALACILSDVPPDIHLVAERTAGNT